VDREHTITDFAADCRRLQDALAAAERDRQLLGYEIHDSLVQDLTAAALLLEGAGQQAQFPTTTEQERFATGLRMLRDSIAVTRQLVESALQMKNQPSDLATELGRVVERFRTEHGLPVTFECGADSPALSAVVSHQLLRIVQESLFNVLKHALATELEVQLALVAGKLRLTIADNGVGFDPAQVSAGHFGLAGIRKRCEMIGADVLFDTAPQHGTKVIVELPLSST
jgi:signal transduction histidine kinase